MDNAIMCVQRKGWTSNSQSLTLLRCRVRQQLHEENKTDRLRARSAAVDCGFPCHTRRTLITIVSWLFHFHAGFWPKETVLFTPRIKLVTGFLTCSRRDLNERRGGIKKQLVRYKPKKHYDEFRNNQGQSLFVDSAALKNSTGKERHNWCEGNARLRRKIVEKVCRTHLRRVVVGSSRDCRFFEHEVLVDVFTAPTDSNTPAQTQPQATTSANT